MTTPAVEHSLKDINSFGRRDISRAFGRRDISRETIRRFAGWGRKRSLSRAEWRGRHM
jgi:hypothetical protein